MGGKQMIAIRRGKTISLDNQRKIRDALRNSNLKDSKGKKINFLNYNDVINEAITQNGLDPNLPTDVKKRRAFDFFARIYNDCEESNRQNKQDAAQQRATNKRQSTAQRQKQSRQVRTERQIETIIQECFKKKQARRQKEIEQNDMMEIDDVVKRLKKGQGQQVDLMNNKQAKRFFNKLKGVDFRLALEFNNQYVSLNSNNIDKYLAEINKDVYFTGNDISNYQAISNFIRKQDSFTVKPDMSIEQFNKIYGNQCFKNQQPEGGFFPFKHVMDGIDLSRYQIWHTSDSLNNNTDHCFIQSLRAGGVEEEKLKNIKKTINGSCRYLKLKLLRQVAEDFELYITVKQLPKKTPEDELTPTEKKIVKKKGQNNVRPYGNKEHFRVDMGLIESHYFNIGKVPITSYAMEHYEKLKDKPRWNEIVEGTKLKADGTPCFEKDKKRFTDSWTMIRKMVSENKNLLRKIAKEELFDCHFHNITDNLRDLDFADSNFQANTFKEKEEQDITNVFFDFETITETTHIPYMCRASCFKDKVFLGKECGRQMLFALDDKYQGKNLRLIAHNASYDWHFLHKYLTRIESCDRGTRMICASGYFKKTKIVIHCSYAKMDMSLKKFPKTFWNDKKNIMPYKELSQKEILPYNLYTEANVEKQFIPHEECVVAVNKQFMNENIGADETTENFKLRKAQFVEGFLKNVEKWGCWKDEKTIDMIKYSSEYCRIDCEILEEGYNIFKQWIQTVCGLNIDSYVTLPSIADAYLKKQGVYKNVDAVSGVVREFISKSLIGGRTMTANNIKYHVKKNLVAIDARSLYPVSMIRMGGVLQGRPKMLEELNYDFLTKQDGYFVEVEITEVGKEYNIPQMSYVNEKSQVRTWTNKMVGKKVVLNKYQLESWIEFHKIKFNIIRGYYYDEGRNTQLKKTMTHLFDTRVEAKKAKNPINLVYKLLANSSYGRSIMKELEYEDHYISTWDTKQKKHSMANVDRHKIKNYNHISTWGIRKINETTYKAKHYRSINSHFNNAHFGCEVLGMSKLIMSEVMCLAEDLGIDIYITDTDSFHIEQDRLYELEEAFENKYGRDLDGQGIGQFHSDFESDIIDDWSIDGKGSFKPHADIEGLIVADEGFYLGKKCYMEHMRPVEILPDFNTEVNVVAKQYCQDRCREHFQKQYEDKNKDTRVFKRWENHYVNSFMEYVRRFECMDEDDNIDILKYKTQHERYMKITDYHIRMKGVSKDSILHEIKKQGITVGDLYLDLYNGKHSIEKYDFDLTCDYQKATFEYTKDLTVRSREKFRRKICFPNKLIGGSPLNICGTYC